MFDQFLVGGKVNTVSTVCGGYTERERHMRFTNAARAEQQRDAVLVDKFQRREFADRCLVDLGIETEIKCLKGDRLRKAGLFEAKLECVLFSSCSVS